MTRSRLALGAAGEDMAADWYRARGYRVLARNWRVREGELDLVLGLHGTIVFCEVKTRRSAAYGLPTEAVTPDKQRRVRGLALRFLRDEGIRARALRFDVASVLGGELTVVESAF